MRVKYHRAGHDTGDPSRTSTAISRKPATVGPDRPVPSLPRSVPSGTLALALGWTGRGGRVSSQGAFTLIEVIISSGLLAVMAVSLYMAIAQGFAVAEVARENLRATQILQEKMETIRLYSWDQINQPGFIPSTFTNYYDTSASPGSKGLVYQGTVVVTNLAIKETYAANLRWVNIQVTWTSSHIRRQRSMQTYVSLYGL